LEREGRTRSRALSFSMQESGQWSGLSTQNNEKYKDNSVSI